MIRDTTPQAPAATPEVQAALAALRTADDLPPEVADRIWSRLATQAAAPSRPDLGFVGSARDFAAPSMTTPAANQPRRLGTVVVALAIAAGLALTFVSLGRSGTTVATHTPADAASYHHPGTAAPIDTQRATPPSTPVAIPVQTPSPTTSTTPVATPTPLPASPPSPRRPTQTTTDPPAPTTAASTLADEAALLQAAQTALSAGSPSTALTELERHRQNFATGVLSREREALYVAALCAAGRLDEGRAAATKFLRAHPTSVLSERVRHACPAPDADVVR